jgi:hypothetical protein
VRKGPVNIRLSVPKQRQLQDAEVYSKLFYETRIKKIVDEEIGDATLTRSERLAKIVEVTKREWAKESDEVKNEVKAKKEEMQAERKQSDPDSAPSAKQCRSAIDNLSHVAAAFLKHIKQTTGWTAFLVVGGPRPDSERELAITS